MPMRLPVPMLPGETLGQFNAVSADEKFARVSTAWAAARVVHQSADFAGAMLNRWRADWSLRGADAMRDHVQRCDLLDKVRRTGLTADAFDSEVVQRAKDSARDAGRRVDLVRAIWRDSPEHEVELHVLSELRDWFARQGLADEWQRLEWVTPNKPRKPRAIVLRTQCERYWRRILRSTHCRAIENVARDVGLVHKRAGCYVSEVTVRRHRAAKARTAAVLDAVHAVNECGQDMTLSELSARNVSNPEVRRAELMTRIAGFELIARELGHTAYFVTITCPSRMHARRTAGLRGTEPNPRFDGTTPKEAQRYLCKQWKDFCRAAARAGIDLYGFRIAEPNHDGTPHWHVLVFFEPKVHHAIVGRRVVERDVPSRRLLVRLLHKYFRLNDSPDEPGALRHRVRSVWIDPERGTAAGYIAKYVAKNIDGYAIEKDLFGNDALAASQRVAAWAWSHRIRQFQQIGGAPVGVWRELRRMHEAQAEHSAAVALALDAVNLGGNRGDQAGDGQRPEGEGRAPSPRAIGWCGYLHLQGGPRVARRSLRMRILRAAPSGELGRYGEEVAPRVEGVVATEVTRSNAEALGYVGGKLCTTAGRAVAESLGVRIDPFEVTRMQRIEVESERCMWQVVPAADVERTRARLLAPASGEAARPWTRVNNCARRSEGRDAWLSQSPAPLFPSAVVRHRKRGQFRRRKDAPG